MEKIVSIEIPAIAKTAIDFIKANRFPNHSGMVGAGSTKNIHISPEIKSTRPPTKNIDIDQ